MKEATVYRGSLTITRAEQGKGSLYASCGPEVERQQPDRQEETRSRPIISSDFRRSGETSSSIASYEINNVTMGKHCELLLFQTSGAMARFGSLDVGDGSRIFFGDVEGYRACISSRVVAQERDL